MSGRPTKRRKVGVSAVFNGQEGGGDFGNDFKRNASRWNIEQDYETRPRKRKTQAENNRLPIKTSQGLIEKMEIDQDEEEDTQSEASSFDSLGSDTPATDVSQPEPEAPRLPPKEEILQAKEELARVAGLLSENPEDHISSLKTLAAITSSRNPVVTKLGLATQLSVYKDVIPGYRIRALSEEDLQAKASKEVRQQRSFEQAIVRGYQTYLKDLARLSHLDPEKDAHRLSEVAISCACNLTEHVAHFNYRPELLKVVLDVLAAGPSRNLGSFEKALAAVENLFTNDEDGNASLEAVGMLFKIIKAKNLRIHESVLNLFLHLRLLSEFAHKASASKVDKDEDGTNGVKPKMSKKDRQHRSKRERKVAKERKTIAKEMQEADATVSYEERDRNQAETLKLVFGIYFRILKARMSKLMGATLEGLVRYAHLINQEFFGDLLEALREIMSEVHGAQDELDEDQEPELENINTTARHALLSTVTAFGLLSGQDAAASANALHLDLSFFTSHLYASLHATALDPDVELSAESITHAPDPNTPDAGPKATVNASTTIVLMLRALRAVLLPSNPRAVPPVRVAAFVKQLMTLATQMPERSASAILGLITEVVKAQRTRVSGMWKSDERKGDGTFDPTAGVESSNPFATSVYEGELLRMHYAPRVREQAGRLTTAVANV